MQRRSNRPDGEAFLAVAVDDVVQRGLTSDLTHQGYDPRNHREHFQQPSIAMHLAQIEPKPGEDPPGRQSPAIVGAAGPSSKKKHVAWDATSNGQQANFGPADFGPYGLGTEPGRLASQGLWHSRVLPGSPQTGSFSINISSSPYPGSSPRTPVPRGRLPDLLANALVVDTLPRDGPASSPRQSAPNTYARRTHIGLAQMHRMRPQRCSRKTATHLRGRPCGRRHPR